MGALIALAATAVAWVVRAALAPVVADQAPYATFFAAIVVSGLLGGWKNAITAGLLGGLVANISFVPPYGAFALDGARGWGLAVYLFVGAILVWLTETAVGALKREAALNEHLSTVSMEYRHRIKNLLTVAQALAQQTGRNSATVEDFQQKLVSRLDALSRSQDLLLERDAGSVIPVNALIEETLEPFELQGRVLSPIEGPSATVSAEAAVAVSLLLNELATNSTKYGALSVPEGRVTLGWSAENDWTEIHWKEVDGPHVTPPEKLGFGSRLFKSALAPSSGDAKLSFENDGVRCVIRLRPRRAQQSAP